MKIIFSKAFMYHDDPKHIENKNRLRPIIKLIKEGKIKYERPYNLNREIYRFLSLAHSWKYIKKIKRIFKKAYRNRKIIYIDKDTYISPRSYLSSFYSILSGIKAIDMIEEEEKIFVPTRPPGHHVGRNGKVNSTQGFCIFNNIAIAAMYARKRYKTLILDVDIHHGNGTEDIVRNKKNVFYISTHAKNYYPFTGNDSYSNIYNYPLEWRTSDKEYIELFKREIEERIKEIDPDIILVSLGYDMHFEDPLSVFRVTEESYKYIFDFLKKYKCIYFLEGGYNKDIIYRISKILLRT